MTAVPEASRSALAMLSASPSASEQAVRQSGQMVMQGPVGHLSFGLLASADVAGDDGRTGELAVGFANRRNAQQDRNLAAVAAQEKRFVQARRLALVDLRKKLSRARSGEVNSAAMDRACASAAV